MYLRSALQVKVSCHPSWQLLPATFPFFFFFFQTAVLLLWLFGEPTLPPPFLWEWRRTRYSGEKKGGISLFGFAADFFLHLFPIPWTFPPAEQWSPNLPPHSTSLLSLPLYYIFPLPLRSPPPLPLIISSFPPNPLPNFASSYQKTCFGNEMMQEEPPLLQESEIGPPKKTKNILVYFKSRHILLIDLQERGKKSTKERQRDVSVQRCTSNTPEPTETRSKISCSFVPTRVTCEDCKELITQEIYLQVFVSTFHFKRWKEEKEKARRLKKKIFF